MLLIDYLLLAVAVLLILSVAASKASGWLGVPALLLLQTRWIDIQAVLWRGVSLATLLGGNGFLAAYMAGIALGNSNFVHKRMLLRIHDSLAWMMQIAMFLTPGLLVYPSRIIPIIGEGLLLSLILMLLARPASVFACLVRSGFSIREKLLISWVGLRGAVPIILATYPLLAGIPLADRIFNFVLELGLPEDIFIAMIKRDDLFIIPTGGTILQPGDALYALLKSDNAEYLNNLRNWFANNPK